MTKQDKKYRKLMLLSYVTNKDEIEKAIIGAGASKYAYIVHDKDVDENGERKKPHTHIVLAFQNARTVNAISKHFNILPQFVEIVKNERQVLRYLIHADNPEKMPYSIDELHFAGYNESIWLTNLSEEERVMQILDIMTDPKVRTYSDLIREAAKAGCWSELRRGGYLFVKAFEELQQQRERETPKK